MFCTNCEFEIKGEGREKCPICGGPLLDFSLLDSEAPEGEKGAPEEKQTGSSQKPTDAPTFDLASLLNDDEEATKQETETQAPAAEELHIEDLEPHTFENAGEEPDIATSESKESTPFDLGDALISDDEIRHGKTQTFDFESTLNESNEQQSTKLEDPAQVSPAPEYKTGPESEPALEELSTEELLRRIADEYKPKEAEDIAPPPAKPQPLPARSSRSISAIAALAVFALIAAIASVAFLTPKEKLYPVIENLKTETEQKISTISHILITKAEKYLTEKEEPQPRIPLKKTQPERTVKKVALYKKPPVQKEVPKVEEKPTATHKTDSANSEQKVTKELTQPLTGSPEETLPPQKNSPPQITEDKEQAPVKHTETQGTRKITYSLHTGSFTKENIASAESERLIRMGFKSYVEKVSLKNGQTWYRIKVGSFSTRKEAEAMQDELKQKAPHIKSYIMRKKVSSKTAVTGEGAEKTKEVAIINPAVSAHRGKTPSHEKPDVVEADPPINETVTGEEAPSPEEKVAVNTEQMQPEMDRISDLPQPVVEVPQEMTDPEKETYSPEKAVALETEQTNPETDHDPYIPETVEEEIPLEDTVSIETLPAAFPEPEDQASVTMDIFPEMGLHEEGVITPLE